MSCTRYTPWKLFQIFVAEALASAMANMVWFLLNPNCLNITMFGSIAAGASIYLAIWCSFTTSGAHINPLVTFAIVITRRLNPLVGVVYVMGELGGTMGGMGIAWAISPFREQASDAYGMTIPGHGVGLVTAIVTEGLSSFLLMMVILASLDELRAKPWQAEMGAPFPFAVMLAIGLNHYLTAPITGGSMNPFRSIAAAIIRNNFDRQWIYFVGPPIGAVVACLCYEFVIGSHASLRRTQSCLSSSKFSRVVSYSSVNSATNNSDLY